MKSDRAWLALILSAAFLVGAIQYAQFLENPRPRWNGLVHDRSSHYEFAQRMAIALREGDVATFFSTLDKAKVWPPVHGLCAAAVLAIGGIDYRLAVLPSLCGWVATAVFGFLLARRISGVNGNAAGVIALALILASPAHRVYAVDIMLESLGAGLSMMALYFYAVAKQERSARAWRWLAITLTVLFFEKYNYWLLVVLALVAAELAGWRVADWRQAAATVRRIDWKRVLGRELRAPLTWVFAVVAALAAAIFILKPAPLQVGGELVGLYPPNNLVTLAYAALFVRLLTLHRFARLEVPAQRQLMLWHCLPIAVSFLFPRRLSAFAWFLGPFNTGEQSRPTLAEAAANFVGSIVADYHAATWSAVVAALLFVVALATYRRLQAGGLAVLLFVLISVVLAVPHPNQKSRFLHTWIPALWVVGAAGLATASSRAGRLRLPLATTASAAVLLAHAPSFFERGHAQETGCRRETISLLDLTDTYLRELGAERKLAIFSTVPATDLLRWTYRDRYPHSHNFEIPLREHRLSAEDVRRRMEDWRAGTAADTVVVIDIAPESPHYLPLADYSAYRQIPEVISSNAQFEVSRRWDLPAHRCTITMWTRK
jgi:hypothetical protein